MATYFQISEHVKKTNGFVPKTCWIAHVLSDHGLTKRMAKNRANSGSRKYPCPEMKRGDIEQALRHFSMI